MGGKEEACGPFWWRLSSRLLVPPLALAAPENWRTKMRVFFSSACVRLQAELLLCFREVKMCVLFNLCDACFISSSGKLRRVIGDLAVAGSGVLSPGHLSQ